MSRRNPNWVKSGDVADFLPTPIETVEREEQYWDGTLEHLSSIARMAASRSHFTARLHDDKQELAFTGISMALVENPDTPVWGLIARGVEAISRAVQEHHGHHGKRTDGGHTGKQFAVFWDMSRPEPAEDRRIEKVAISQVWWALEEKHQQTLLGRIAHPDTTEHAASVGLSVAGVRKRIRQARQAALDLWFDWEPAPKPAPDMPRATHCKQGHNQDEHGSWMVRSGRGRVRYCLTCANERNEKLRERKPV